MSERVNRFIVGFCLIAFLLLGWDYAIWAIVSILLIEGLTNWRVPIIVSKLRYATDGVAPNFEENKNCKLNFEAERMLRFSVAATVTLGVIFNELLWFLPYFVGLNLVLAGITGLCPLVMLFRKLGLR